MKYKHYDDGVEGRFFIILDSGMEAGWIQYKWLGNGILLANGTRVYEEFKDQKLGSPLFDRLIAFAIEKNVKIYPTCPFVVKNFARKPELHDRLADDYLVSTLWSTSMNNLMLFLALVDEQRRKKSPDVCYDSRLAAERPEQETLLRGKWHQ